MESAASKAIERFEDLLRLVAPGFVCVLLILVIDPQHGKWLQGSIGEDKWRLAIFACLLSLLAYSIHFAALESLFIRVMLDVLVRRDALIRRYLDQRIASATQTSQPEYRLQRLPIPALAHDRWARKASSDHRMRSIQRSLSRQYAYLHFMYCSSYLGILLALLVYFEAPFQPAIGHWKLQLLVWSMLAGALVKDYLVTRHELVLFINYPELEKVEDYVLAPQAPTSKRH